MKGFSKRIQLLGGLFTAWLILMALPLQLLGQITIEEELELSNDSTIHPMHQKSSMMTSASSEPVNFEVEQAGPLKIVFEKGRRFKESLQKTKIDISITDPDGKVKYKRKVSPDDFFSEPIQGRLTPKCSDMWYLYGEGPFNWQSGNNPETIDDARVFSLSCSASFAEQTGNCRSTNFPETHISMWGWTWNGDPAILRSYIRFNGLEFLGPVKLEDARLQLFHAGSSQLSGSNAFTVSRVSSSWNEYSVTWNNKPGFSSPTIDGPSGSSNVNINVSPIVETWLENPGSNYGFGLALKNENYYRNRNFYSSEAQAPPVLDVEISNPEARSDTLYVAYVNEGDQVSIEYESNGEVYASNTKTQKTINGEETTGRQFIFNVDGPTCGNQGFSEHLEVFGWVDVAPLTIEIPEPKEAWPTIPTGGARWEFFEYANIENMIEDIEITLVDNGNPVGGHQIKIEAQWISEHAGGHYHDGSKDTEPISRSMGSLVNLATGDSLRGRLNTTTGADGAISLKYWTPQFGGEVELVASTILNGEQLTARDTLIVRVPNLEPLTDGTNYSKVGGTDEHHGPRLDNLYSEYRTPDTNHYGTKAFVDSLESLANAWHGLVLQDSTQDERQTPLNINDMSLPYGGKFDINGRWSTIAKKHAYHRVGRDVDIRTTRSFSSLHPARNAIHLTVLLDAEGKPQKNANGKIIYENAEFEDLGESKGTNPRPSVHDLGGKAEHYHLYFY